MKNSVDHVLTVLVMVCVLIAQFDAITHAETATNTETVRPEKIVGMALKHSIKLKSLVRDETAAKALEDQAIAQRYPQLSIDAKSQHYTGLTSFQVGSMLTIPEIENRYNAGATLNQPIYTGGRLKSLQQSAALGRRAVEKEQKATEASVIMEAFTGYWNWSMLYYQLDALRAAVQRMDAHARDIRNLKNAGMATENDVLSSEVLLEQTRLKYEEAIRKLEIVKAWIEYLTGEKLATNQMPIKPSASTNIVVLSEQELILAALQNRNERAAQILKVQSMEEKVRIVEAEYYPQVSVVARYEQARPNLMNFPPRDKWQDDAFVGVVVSWNVLDWGLRGAKVREAAARRDQTRLILEQIDDQIHYEVRSSRIKLLDALAKFAVSTRILEKATSNLAVVNDLWKNGLARHSEVLDAHAQLTEAQFGLISAGAEIEIARLQLQYAIGALSPDILK